jgi:hypothetical protein
MNKYQVIVSNVGTVYDGNDEQAAKKEYSEYVSFSKEKYGRCSGENVTLLEDGEPISEFWSAAFPYECPQCGEVMSDIGDSVYQCPDCNYETGKDELDCILLRGVLEDAQAVLEKMDADRFESSLMTRIEKVLNVTG